MSSFSSDVISGCIRLWVWQGWKVQGDLVHLCSGSGFFSTGPQSPLQCGGLRATRGFQEGKSEAASSKAEPQTCIAFVPLHSVGQPSQRPSQIQGVEKTDSINRLSLIMIIDYHYCQIQNSIAKFRLKLKKVMKTTRPFKYDLNQIPFDYTEVTNRFKGLDLIDRIPEELWTKVHDTCRRQ